MGTAVLDERASSERSQARVNSKKAQSVLSPVYRRSITGTAPSTPSAAMQTEGCKRFTKTATDDDQDSLDDSSNEKEFRQYEKWTAEEEHIFFLKLSTVTSLSLLDGFRAIAHHLPEKNCDQVKWYFYRLKGQFQKHNPSRDVEYLSQKELFQAMSSMWSEWSSGVRQKSLSQRRRLHDPIRRARYIEIMQQSLERAFEAKERKEARIAERKAEKVAQQKAARQAEKLRRKQEGQMAARLQAEQEAQRRQLKRAQQNKKSAAAAGAVKENSSLASNMSRNRLKGKAHLQTTDVAKSACCKQTTAQLEREECGRHRAKAPKRENASTAAADTEASAGSGSLDSETPLSPETESLTQADTASVPAQSEGVSEEEEHEVQLTQPQSDSDAVQQPTFHIQQPTFRIQQHSSMSQHSVAAASGTAGWPQQSAAEGLAVPELLPAQRKEPLCLRVRPLDSPTRRLMQSLGCTALLEMPNNKPKKAVEGLLRHLQKKWEKVTAQLGSGYELHLVGLLFGQQDTCVSWRSQGISTLLSLGQVQQQLQQKGPFLELSYVWLPAASLHLSGHTPDASDTVAQSKACISALAAAGYALAKQRDTASQADAIQRAAEPSDVGVPGRRSHRSAVATSSSSSAPVVSEAFSNLQPAASASFRTAAGSTGQRSAAGENQAPALGLDVNSSVSSLVTPGKEQLSSLREACIAEPAHTPGSSHLAAPSAHQGLAWENSPLLGHVDSEFEPRLSQSHPDITAATHRLQAEVDGTQQCDDDTELPTLLQMCQSNQPQGQEAPEANMDLNCSQSHGQEAVPDCPRQASTPLLDSLAEQPSGFLSCEPSVWSIQPTGALSAEPSGCWDDLPDVPLSSKNCLAATTRQQQLEPDKAELNACMGGVGSQVHAKPDPLCISELDFDLPPLDSPEQAVVLDVTPAKDRVQTAAVLELLQTTPSMAQQPHGHELDSRHEAPQGDAMECARAGDDSSLTEAHETSGSGLMMAVLSSEVDIPEASRPARGVPLMGTVVVGVPINGATKQGKKGRPACAKPTKDQQAKPAKAAAASKPQQHAEESGDTPGPKKPTAKYRKKRKVPYESPPRLPPISPGALNLQAGVKRRRLAKQLEQQAAAEAASGISQDDAQTKLFCEQLGQLASKAAAETASPAQGVQQATSAGHKLTRFPQADAIHPDEHPRQVPGDTEMADVGQACGGCAQQPAKNDSQAQLCPDTQSPASQKASQGASKGASQGASMGAYQAGGKQAQSDQVLRSPGSKEKHVSWGSSDACPPPSAEQGPKSDEEPRTLSFDVAAMELFRQQDTCDAFGSFWRRTSGVEVPGNQKAAQQHTPAPSAFGVGDISLGCWTDNQQAQQATVPGAAGSSPADGTGQPQGCHMVPDEAPQLSTAHNCGPMDLTNYFATLPNEVVAFKDLVMPSPSEVPSLGLAEQQVPQLSGADDPPQSNEQSDEMHASSLDKEEGTSGCSSGVSEMASRPPTQQEIQHMDELDLSINLGALLGLGDSWMVEEEDQLEVSHLEPQATASNCGSLEGCKPFSELFP